MSLKSQSQKYYTLGIKTKLKHSSTEIFTFFIKWLSTSLKKYPGEEKKTINVSRPYSGTGARQPRIIHLIRIGKFNSEQLFPI